MSSSVFRFSINQNTILMLAEQVFPKHGIYSAADTPGSGQNTSTEVFQKKIDKCPTNIEKMLNISNHQGNENENRNEISSYPCQNGHY